MGDIGYILRVYMVILKPFHSVDVNTSFLGASSIGAEWKTTLEEWFNWLFLCQYLRVWCFQKKRIHSCVVIYSVIKHQNFIFQPLFLKLI